MDNTAPWQVTKRRQVYQNPWSTLIEDELEGPQGQDGLYAYFDTVNHVLVCPLHEDGSITMVEQWRHAYGCWSLEFPCGAIDPGEDAQACAKRELAEEARLQASKLQTLGSYDHSDARVAGRGHLFVATGLSPVQTCVDRDESEADMRIVHMTLSQARAACERGRICAISSQYALLILEQHCATKDPACPVSIAKQPTANG